MWLLKPENLTTKALSKPDGGEEGPLFQKIGGCRQYALLRLTLFCPNSLGHISAAVFCSFENLIIEHVLSPPATLKSIAVELVRLVSVFSLWNVL